VSAILSDILGRVAGLAEAEALAARRGVIRLLTAASLMATGVLFLTAVVVLVAMGFYLLLAPAVGLTGGAFLTAAIVLVFGLGWWRSVGGTPVSTPTRRAQAAQSGAEASGQGYLVCAGGSARRAGRVSASPAFEDQPCRPRGKEGEGGGVGNIDQTNSKMIGSNRRQSVRRVQVAHAAAERASPHASVGAR